MGIKAANVVHAKLWDIRPRSCFWVSVYLKNIQKQRSGVEDLSVHSCASVYLKSCRSDIGTSETYFYNVDFRYQV